MAAEDNWLTLEGLAQRLESLERENERMRSENAELRHKVATLEGSGAPRARDEETAPEPSGPEERVSRRWLLSRAGAAAASLVVAGALTQRDIREAKAAEPFFNSTNTANRGAIEGENLSFSGFGVWGNSNNLGVHGTGGHTGVLGVSIPSSPTNQGTGVQGSHQSNGPGVLGDSAGGAGVQARSFGGTTGAVYGKHSAQGYGGLFEGGRAQLKLVPASSRGKPTGAHTKGEIYMDSAAALFVCVKGGTPGTWRKVSTTAV